MFRYFLRNNLACQIFSIFILRLHDQERWLAYRDPIQPDWRDGYANAYVPI